MHDRELAKGCIEHADSCKRLGLIGQEDFQNTRTSAECGERLSRAQQVDQAATDGVTADGIFRYDSSIRIGQEEPPSGGRSPGWEDTCQCDLSLVYNGCGTVERPLQALGGEV
ncbi:MAG TPA: hypothetical protein VGD41_19275, partial [Pyrinomonadaceae bacterium]